MRAEKAAHIATVLIALFTALSIAVVYFNYLSTKEIDSELEANRVYREYLSHMSELTRDSNVEDPCRETNYQGYFNCEIGIAAAEAILSLRPGESTWCHTVAYMVLDHKGHIDAEDISSRASDRVFFDFVEHVLEVKDAEKVNCPIE